MKQTLAADPLTKLIFLCSPGNPTGTLLSLKDIQELLEFEEFKGVVVVDEAYIDFARAEASVRLASEGEGGKGKEEEEKVRACLPAVWPVSG